MFVGSAYWRCEGTISEGLFFLYPVGSFLDLFPGYRVSNSTVGLGSFSSELFPGYRVSIGTASGVQGFKQYRLVGQGTCGKTSTCGLGVPMASLSTCGVARLFGHLCGVSF